MNVGNAPRGSFDDLAETYDRFRIGYAPELYEALTEFGLAAGSRVIDVGCGTGIAAIELEQRGCTVTGVDVSPAMLARARERLPKARFVEARVEELPFEDAAFDAGASAQAFHWFDQPRALSELLRVVRPGGVVAVWWKGLMRGDATRLLRDEVARELQLVAPADLLTADFRAFESSPLVDRRLRIIPWNVPTTVDDYIGYERSRARARDAFGGRIDEYFARLSARLGPPGATMSLSYLQLLYLGRVPARASA